MLSLKAATYFLICLTFFVLISCGPAVDKSMDSVEPEYAGFRRIYVNEHTTFGSLREAVYAASCLENAFPIRIQLSAKRTDSLPLLPPDCKDDDVCYKERNVMVLKRLSNFNSDSLQAHILNEELLSHLAISPAEAVVFLDLEDNTSIDDFKALVDDLMNTYTSIWEDKSKDMYGLPLNRLSKEQHGALKEQYPVYIKLWAGYR